MRRKKNMAEEDFAALEVAPETPVEPVVVLPGNCGGDLVLLPDIEGTTYHEYTCKVCGQLVHVGLEDLEANGLPTQHHKREEDK
jgi:hypothetical protein